MGEIAAYTGGPLYDHAGVWESREVSVIRLGSLGCEFFPSTSCHQLLPKTDCFLFHSRALATGLQ